MAAPEVADRGVEGVSMTIDFRKLLRDLLRGTLYDFDTVAAPVAIDAQGEAAASPPEELVAFVELLDEVLAVEMAVEPETRPSVLRELERLRQECLEAAGRPPGHL
jgi:hypothetical protein